ncbi:hypothetical protein PI95_013040 [Hassallia byssoidea VB512170]|uniref:Uncharacterized protein n=1 Tax=Hassallia byssoidea VB512170 TaxID=1304833 RepID=A0A846H9W5_9CYAN|nr:hypothetical protein [Hassalia byssoidea]NEU73464.1 hypothetical protein [Hassalia byssoidea VB512170]
MFPQERVWGVGKGGSRGSVVWGTRGTRGTRGMGGMGEYQLPITNYPLPITPLPIPHFQNLPDRLSNLGLNIQEIRYRLSCQ